MADQSSDPASHDPRFGEVLAELLVAEEQGQAPDLESCVRRFPEQEAPLRAYFQDRERFARAALHLAAGPVGGGATGQCPGASATAMSLAPGSRFGGYEIEETVGHGGMGVVYRARQLVPDRRVAVKVIRTDRLAALPADDQRLWVKRFHHEAQMVASLDVHPHIVTLYEVGEHDGRPYFTMRLLSGGNLATACSRPRRPARKRCSGGRRVWLRRWRARSTTHTSAASSTAI
jgi:serine/threonine-protein kinase